MMRNSNLNPLTLTWRKTTYFPPKRKNQKRILKKNIFFNLRDIRRIAKQKRRIFIFLAIFLEIRRFKIKKIYILFIIFVNNSIIYVVLKFKSTYFKNIA